MTYCVSSILILVFSMEKMASNYHFSILMYRSLLAAWYSVKVILTGSALLWCSATMNSTLAGNGPDAPTSLV